MEFIEVLNVFPANQIARNKHDDEELELYLYNTNFKLSNCKEKL